MDSPSSSTHHNHHSTKHHHRHQQQQQDLPMIPSKSLPYYSLLLELHTLDPQHQIWTSDFEKAPFTRQEIMNIQQDIKIQKMIFMLLKNHGVRSQSLRDIQTMAETEAERIQKLAEDFADNDDDRGSKARLNYRAELKSGINKFMETLHQKIKPRLKEFCLQIVHRLLQGNCSVTVTGEYAIFNFIDVILLNLKHFKKLKPNLIVPVMNQLQILEHMLNYAPIIAKKLINLDENLQNFLVFFEPWVNTAAAVVIPYWLDDSDERAFTMVSSSLQKFTLSLLQYVEAYILVLKALQPSTASEILVMRNAVEQFIEIIMEKFIMSTDDLFDMFREGLTFWTALLVDPPKSDAEHEKLICSQIHLLLDQAKSSIRSMCLVEDVGERRNTLLNDFLEKINKVKAEVRLLQVHQIPGLSRNNDPEEYTKGRFDLLLGTLQKKFDVEAGFLPFEKHIVATVQEELSLLRPFLLDIFELEDKHKDLNDIWIQASNIAYIVDYVSDFCLASTDIPIWSSLMHLSNAVERIQSVKTQVSKIRQNNQLQSNRVSNGNVNSQIILHARQEGYDARTKDDFSVGFVEEEKRIIDCLVAGEAGREIVVVVGMGGQGKTHLAQRVFQKTSIKLHFYILAWCCISQAYDIKKVLRDILEGIGETVSPELYQSLTQEDLADKLRKCLMGQKYLIVLDDMWDAKAWFDFEESFPNVDGSRILITSRNLNVALKVKAKCSIVELNPLSCEESWSLLQMKVFHGDYCPPTLFEIGKTIAENCKGLPLAVVVVAGLLKKDKNVESWKKICESLKPLIAREGCMDIIELSYKHLPDYLKPCFLYLGAFKEDEAIYANQLIRFWIAEGFVQNDGMKSRELVANEYLIDFASRNLIFVAQKSSRNRIKECFVHDLLHQFCQIKVEEERFLLVLNDMSEGSSALYSKHYRISVHDKWGPFADSKPIVPGLRSLLVYARRISFDSYTPSFLKEFKLIRVLDMTTVVVTKVNFHYITQLIHLRLLAVFCRFPVPPSIANLLKLEMLRFNEGDRLGILLPSVVIKMPSLRHIFAMECKFDYIDCYDEFVNDMSSSSLKSLETLTTVHFSDELSFKRVAQGLQN